MLLFSIMAVGNISRSTCNNMIQMCFSRRVPVILYSGLEWKLDSPLIHIYGQAYFTSSGDSMCVIYPAGIRLPGVGMVQAKRRTIRRWLA